MGVKADATGNGIIPKIWRCVCRWTEKKLVEKGREAAGEQLLGRRLVAGCLGC